MPSQKETGLSTIHFSGTMLNFGGVTCPHLTGTFEDGVLFPMLHVWNIGDVYIIYKPACNWYHASTYHDVIPGLMIFYDS